MATRDEAHTTRGRANSLRLAMSGQLGDAGLADKAVYKVLDLCLECRACKAECPVNVDMARYKSEFLAKYHEKHGTPLETKALGGVAKLAGLGSAFAPLSNWIAGSGFNKKLLGVDARRTLPKWRRDTFAKWAKAKEGETIRRRAASGCVKGGGYFSTTPSRIITNPKSASPAWRCWSRRLPPVDVVRPGCCGRPLISKRIVEGRQARPPSENSGEGSAGQSGYC